MYGEVVRENIIPILAEKREPQYSSNSKSFNLGYSVKNRAKLKLNFTDPKLEVVFYPNYFYIAIIISL